MVNAWVLVPDRDQCILLDVPGTPFYNPVRRVVIGGTYERIASIESSPQPGPQYAVSGRNTLITETGRNVGASLDVNNGRAKDHSLIIGPADPASTRLLDEGIPSEGYVSTYSSGW
jgi:hypothetical protein